jgi:hypothetical protein
MEWLYLCGITTVVSRGFLLLLYQRAAYPFAGWVKRLAAGGYYAHVLARFTLT